MTPLKERIINNKNISLAQKSQILEQWDFLSNSQKKRLEQGLLSEQVFALQTKNALHEMEKALLKAQQKVVQEAEKIKSTNLLSKLQNG